MHNNTLVNYLLDNRNVTSSGVRHMVWVATRNLTAAPVGSYQAHVIIPKDYPRGKIGSENRPACGPIELWNSKCFQPKCHQTPERTSLPGTYIPAPIAAYSRG